ncbi:hypothetical protein [Gracilibacillus sp. JCM 18860]|uniref:hypothetical protein n=1 Tax=Gracilibacillus sp. JCM 18860 TaxID=1306159 RepID=UPI0006D22F60
MENAILNIFEDWEKKLENDEWYFQNAYENLVEGLTSEEAFLQIPAIIHILLKTVDCFLLSEGVEILIGIYHIADTTQVHPPFFEEKRVDIEHHLSKHGDQHAQEVYGALKRRTYA